MSYKRRTNEVKFIGNEVHIKMTNCDEWTVLDAADYPKVKGFTWLKDKKNDNGYAWAWPSREQAADLGVPYGRYVYMHRIINGTDSDMVTDHIDRNKMNNRRSNLRECTQGQNAINRTKSKGKSSQYMGVRFIKKYADKPTPNKWEANITLNKKQKCIGTFPSEKDAALAYDRYAYQMFGEYAALNFPELIQEAI